jgi:osmotically-inducible protein OsmY
VTLTGEVDNLRAKKAAEEDARNVPGVWRVRNHLRVRPVEVVPDEKLERRIQSAFVRDPYVDRFEITVDALHGAVYLRGTVDYPYERTRAETLASTLNGVVEVHNLIDVRDAEPVVKDDWEIEADIEDQIFWSPFVDSDEIVVDVEGGIATLTGTVDSFQERRMAVENAYQGGALSVINKIRIRSVEPTDTGS